MSRPSNTVAAALLATLLLLAAVVTGLNRRDEAPVDDSDPPTALAPETVARGAYLALAGNCAGCHTARGGQPFAGGRAIETPFGTVYSSNLTPDPETGLGRWNAAQFWRALHNGRSRDGRLLYPAFPYPDFSRVKREDADAIYAYLRTLAPVHRPARAHDLRFPYDLQVSLAVWRALYFRPGEFKARADKPADWNRGAYLVQGLGHCEACHAPRNALGATASTSSELSGGLIPMQNWFAPALAARTGAGVGDWSAEEVFSLLKTGTAPRGSVMGPMAEVVSLSTQHLADGDLHAMVAYLRDLPAPAAPTMEKHRADPSRVAAGRQLYEDRCSSCHGKQGQGGEGGVYPPLAGHWAVAAENPANLVHAILNGGFAPSTAGNPRPYGMPPFAQALDDEQVAAIATYVRRSWGNDASEVQPFEVMKLR